MVLLGLWVSHKADCCLIALRREIERLTRVSLHHVLFHLPLPFGKMHDGLVGTET